MNQFIPIIQTILIISELQVLMQMESSLKQNFNQYQTLQPYKQTMEFLNTQSLVWPRLECETPVQDIVDSLPKVIITYLNIYIIFIINYILTFFLFSLFFFFLQKIIGSNSISFTPYTRFKSSVSHLSIL